MIDKILSFLTPVFGVLDELIEDKDKANEIKARIQAQMLNNKSELMKAASGIITAEINGESWLQRNWRPLMMLWFSGLVGAHWLGFTPPNLPESVVNNLLDIVQIGIGGYVLGRSGEKIMTAYKEDK